MSDHPVRNLSRSRRAFLKAGGRYPFGLSIMIAGIKPEK